MKLSKLVFALLFGLCVGVISAQTVPAGYPVLIEYSRRSQLNDSLAQPYSFLFRTVTLNPSSLFSNTQDTLDDTRFSEYTILPILFSTRYSSKRPYGWGDYGMIPGVGGQTYLSSGIHAKVSILHLQFQPEWVAAQNLSYQGFSRGFSNDITKERFFFWNLGDYPERFGEGTYSKFWWGQSSLTLRLGAFEAGAATRNIWWGPGQWNSLTFSNNAQGFLHLTLNTIKPAKTFIGNFETQLIVGKLNSSGFDPSQYKDLNALYFEPLSNDWRYLNAWMLSYNPKWVSNLFLGFARTFQVYSEVKGDSFSDWLPIFDAFQKEKFFKNTHTVEFDANGQDQQMVVFGRYIVFKAKAEIYFEYGRRDHAYNWREFTLNPEHARAYIIGFNKLFSLSRQNRQLQVRGEMTHQQNSVNGYIRYPGLKGGSTWHTHYQSRGFSNYGQPLGVGIGVGSNVQTMEMSLVEGMDKVGFLVERLANNQVFYYRAQLQETERKPWIDLSVGFLYDRKFGNLLLSSKLQLIHARNYQWELDPASTPEFPQGKNLTSVMAQASLIYFWNKTEK